MTGSDGEEPRSWFAEDAAEFKTSERLRMAYNPGRTWTRLAKPPSRWTRWWSRLLWRRR